MWTPFTTPKITKALITTFKYSFITVPLKLVFALFIAYILKLQDCLRERVPAPSTTIPLHPRRLCCYRRAVEGRVSVMTVWVNTLIRMLTFGHFQGPSC